MAKKEDAREKLARLLEKKERLVAALVATARRFDHTQQRIRATLRRIEKKEREAAGHPSNAAALEQACTQCDVGPGAKCIGDFRGSLVPFHKNRVRKAIMAAEAALGRPIEGVS